MGGVCTLRPGADAQQQRGNVLDE